MDDNRNGTLDKYEFAKAMNDFMLGFSESEVNALFSFIDVNRNGAIHYDEFLRAIRGPMNAFRLGWVSKAFAKFDKDGNGYIDSHDLQGVYDASKHPDVI